MIVDTSALVAILRAEPGHEPIEHALLHEDGLLPAPALVEFRRVTSLPGNKPRPAADHLIDVLGDSLSVTAFDQEDALVASEAVERYGTGNKRGGTLNLLDLMVYAVAKRLSRPILCTGKDFTKTDALIHPASRAW